MKDNAPMTHPPRGHVVRSAGARQDLIVRHVVANGSETPAELATMTGVSLMTVHRDLDELVRKGLLRKYRGGVSALPSSVFESNVEYRLRAYPREKEAIARMAVTLIEPGMSVLLDDSTTALAVARLLVGAGPLTVITNFVRAVDLLKSAPEIRLIGLGGDYSRTHDSYNGVACGEAVAALRVDIAFVSTSAMTATATYHQEQEIVLVKRAMLDAAGTKVLLMDSSKLARTALYRLAPVSAFDQLVVDVGAPAEVIAALREQLPVELVFLTPND